DKKKWVSESQLKDAHDTLLRAYGIPEFGLTIQQIHNFRLRQSLLYPKMYSRRQDGSIEEKCRPLEAAYLLFLIDFDFQSAGADPAAQGVPPTLPPPKNFAATHISVSVDVLSEREMKYRRARANFFSSASQKTIDELMLSLLSKLNL